MNYDPANLQHRQELARSLREALTKASFTKQPSKGNTKEEVWGWTTSNPKIKVLVYTTIVRDECRSSGKDAVRTALIYTNDKDQERPMLPRETRVNRTGEIEGIVERTLMRVRKVFKDGKDVCKCEHCGAPTFKSRKGNQVCMEFCWEKPQPSQPTHATSTDKAPAIREYSHIPF